jgi:quercetin dioxygenase-like cupin family protein
LLAQIEAGDANPSLSSLLALAEGFEIVISELLAEPSPAPINVRRATAPTPVLWTGAAGGTGRLLGATGPLELWEFVLQPGEALESAAHRSGSREVLRVVDGTLGLEVGAEAAELAVGDCASFEADLDHSYRTLGDGAVSFVLAVYDPAADHGKGAGQ